MGQALYRKYRSKSLEEIIGQEHISSTLSNALNSGKLSHAYLFTGPRGVGKTSIARILAHAVNELPYDDDSGDIDIIEIDAASNRRIDEIRDLREKVYIAPAVSKYKVYIIDEVHMLTKEAFNALLKTLEEPPAHVIFILATTDAHKLPETIISRTQRFTFRPVPFDKVTKHLKTIADAEHITIDDAALQLIAEHGEGSFRDSISLLDQARGYPEPINAKTVREMLGIPTEESVQNVIQAIITGSVQTILQSTNPLFAQGAPAQTIATLIAAELRQDIVNGSRLMSRNDALTILHELLEVPRASDPERYLEIVLLRAAAVISKENPSPDKSKNQEPVETKSVAEDVVKEVELAKHDPVKPEAAKEKQPEEASKNGATKTKEVPAVAAVKQLYSASNDELWQELLNNLKKHHNTLYGVIRMAQPKFTDNSLVLAFTFAFHQKRISEARNLKIVTDLLGSLSGKPLHISSIVDKKAVAPANLDKSAEHKKLPKNDLSTISNIFGGGELIES